MCNFGSDTGRAHAPDWPQLRFDFTQLGDLGGEHLPHLGDISGVEVLEHSLTRFGGLILLNHAADKRVDSAGRHFLPGAEDQVEFRRGDSSLPVEQGPSDSELIAGCLVWIYLQADGEIEDVFSLQGAYPVTLGHLPKAIQFFADPDSRREGYAHSRTIDDYGPCSFELFLNDVLDVRLRDVPEPAAGR